MDPQIPSPAAPEPSAATLHNATVDKAEGNEFRNTARSRLLQATAIPALQGHLTAPDDVYNSVHATISLTLPHELVERILLLLDTKSILKCRLVNRDFNAIIQSSTLVQYYLACKAAGVVDNPQSPLSYAERLGALQKREDAWMKLEPVFETTIKLDGLPSTLYELRAGIYFLCDDIEKDLYYCRLPSSLQDNPQWSRVLGHGPTHSWSGSIVGMGMAVYEHDLIVNVISSQVGNQANMQQHSLDLVLLKFSTGEYHPLARHPLIHVQRSPLAHPYNSIKIVGDNLAFVTHDNYASSLYIFDWKTGLQRLRHRATEDAYKYSVPVFVSPELLLVPNRILFRFEVWHLIPSLPNSNPPIQILSLQVPAVSDKYSVARIYCHGELDPFVHSMPYFPPRPFFPSSENSIIIVNLRFVASLGFASTYQLIMHRRTLLDVIQKFSSSSLLEKQDGLPIWLTNEVIVHKVADPDDGQFKFGAQSELVSTMPHSGTSQQTRDSPTRETSQISSISRVSANSSSSFIPSDSTSRYNILQVKWADWGPPISRWFQLSGTETWRITQSNGQRWVFLDRNPHDKKCMVSVADFNLYNVKRNAEMTTQRGRGEHSNGRNGNNGDEGMEDNEEGLEILDHAGVFSEEVYMGLKCVIYHAPGEYDFDGVLMDEERLLGLKLDSKTNRPESIKVLYFG